MNEKQAKALRRALLPNPRREVGRSRGHVIRTLTEYEAKRTTTRKPFMRLQLELKEGCPRQVYQKLKGEINAGR